MLLYKERLTRRTAGNRDRSSLSVAYRSTQPFTSCDQRHTLSAGNARYPAGLSVWLLHLPLQLQVFCQIGFGQHVVGGALSSLVCGLR